MPRRIVVIRRKAVFAARAISRGPWTRRICHGPAPHLDIPLLHPVPRVRTLPAMLSPLRHQVSDDCPVQNIHTEYIVARDPLLVPSTASFTRGFPKRHRKLAEETGPRGVLMPSPPLPHY